MSPLAEFLLQTLAAGGLVSTLPRLLSILTRKRHLDTKGEIDRFEATLSAQDKLLIRAQERVAELEKELQKERVDRIADRTYFFEQLAAANKRLSECEGILTRNGWKEPRQKRRDSGGGKAG